MMISVIITAYNSGERLEGFYTNLKDALNKISGHEHEIIFVDDQSEDSTLARLKDIRERDASVKIIKWHHRAGQHLAMMSGMRLCQGSLAITMDDDFYEETRHIELFIDKIREGYDIVLGMRRGRYAPFFKRKLPAFLLNLIVSLLLGRRIHDIGYNFNAFTADSLKVLNEYETIIDSLREFRKFNMAEVSVDLSRGPRTYNSRYSLKDMVNLGKKIIISSSKINFHPQEQHALGKYEVLG